jgi:type IV secretion system protein VirD4
MNSPICFYIGSAFSFVTVIILMTIALPVAEILVHGWYTDSWPRNTITPEAWFDALWHGDFQRILRVYIALIDGEAALPPETFVTLLITCLSGAIPGILVATADQKRDPAGAFGHSRWANSSEIRKMNSGLLLGRSLINGQSVRVRVEGNLLSIAPPSSGKGAGLIIPNLLLVDERAWNGPVIVIDVKGEAATATTERRRSLGRQVVNLDPLGIVEAPNPIPATFNPLVSASSADILGLQRLAAAIIPQTPGDSDAGQHYRAKTIELFVAAFLVAIERDMRALYFVRDLILGDPAMFARSIRELAERRPEFSGAANGALLTLTANEDVRSRIMTSATPALSWLADPRLAQFTSSQSFEMRDILTGETDIFLSIPTHDVKALAPLIRIFLSQVFETVRRTMPEQRILVIIDEAAALGKFDEIVTGYAEMPGQGLSIWSFWQTRYQLRATYDADTAGTLFQTSEFVTFSKVAAADGQFEAGEWSKALGDVTALVKSSAVSQSSGNERSGSSHGNSESTNPQRAQLLPASEITKLPPGQIVVLPNSDHYTNHAVKMRRLRYFKDAEFKGLYRNPSKGRRAR